MIILLLESYLYNWEGAYYDMGMTFSCRIVIDDDDGDDDTDDVDDDLLLVRCAREGTNHDMGITFFWCTVPRWLCLLIFVQLGGYHVIMMMKMTFSWCTVPGWQHRSREESLGWPSSFCKAGRLMPENDFSFVIYHFDPVEKVDGGVRQFSYSRSFDD